MGASFWCPRGRQKREKDAATADQRTMGECRRQRGEAVGQQCEQRASERATHQPWSSFNNQGRQHLVFHNMFQTSSVQLFLILSLLQCEAALFAPPLQHLRQCPTRTIDTKPPSMAAKPPPTAVMDASASHASHPLKTHGVEERALEATQ